MRIQKRIMLLLLVLLPSVGNAYFPTGPNHTLDQPSFNLLANKFLVIKNLGYFILGVTEDGFLLYTISTTDSVLVPVRKTYTDFTTASVRLVDNQLIFRSDSNVLYFYDITDLPDVVYQGKLDLDIPFADYAIDGRYIYVSRWYDGISRYRINSFSNVVFADSSMKGVLVTDLAIQGRYLYALDEYNGIMRYELGSNFFGNFVDYLYLGERAYTFLLSGTTALVQTKSPNVYRGEMFLSDTLVHMVIDSIGVSTTNRQMLRDDNRLVLISERSVEVINTPKPMMHIKDYDIDDILPNGDIVHIGTKSFLLLPGKTNGALFVPLGGLGGEPFPALSRPGIITGLTLYDDALVTAGAANPIDVYDFDSLQEPEFAYTIPNTPSSIRSFDRSGDTLAILYSPESRIDLIIHPTMQDSLDVLSYPYARTASAQSIQLFSSLLDSLPAVVVQHANELQMIPWPSGDTADVLPKTWEVPTQINDFFIHDSLLLVATTKRTIVCYSIDSTFETKYRTTLNFLNNVTDFYLLNDQQVLLFNERLISRCDISNPYMPSVDSTIVLPISITDVDEENNVLFGVGPNGVGVFSLKSSMPVLIDKGGKWGMEISALNTTIATTDGAQIHLYHLRDYSNDSLPAPPPEPIVPVSFALKQNYPNPFNGKTHISFDVPATGAVKIIVFNILGQHVATLFDRTVEAGTYDITWDGKTDSGNETASGVYYYRLTTPKTRLTRKMILVK